MQSRKGPITITAGEAMEVNRRTKFNGTNWVYADVEDHHAVTAESALAAGDIIPAVPRGREGTIVLVASGAITAGAKCYPAADGKITATVQHKPVAVALEAASADGDEIECLLLQDRSLVAARSAELDHADFTDGGSTAGSKDTGIDIPAGATVVGWEASVTEAFAGDTTGTVEVGDAGDPDRFNGTTDPSVYTTGLKTSEPPAGNGHCPTAVDVLVKITGTSDWGNVTAGKLYLTVFYLEP